MAAGLPTGVRAAEAGGTVGIASDNVVRGITVSDGDPVLTIDLDGHTDGGWHAQAGAAVLASDPLHSPSQFDVGVGHGWQIDNDWTTAVDLTHYRYEPLGQEPRYDADEIALAIGWRGRASVALVYSPDNGSIDTYGRPGKGRAFAYEASWHQPLGGRFAIDAGAGWRDLQAVSGTSYAYGSVALSWGIGPVQTFLTAIGSRAGERGVVPTAYAGNRVVAALAWGF